MSRNNTIAFERSEAKNSTEIHDSKILPVALSAGEEELVSELVHALRTIRYGSIAVTLHDGRIVEIQRTERIRTSGSKATSAAVSGEYKD